MARLLSLLSLALGAGLAANAQDARPPDRTVMEALLSEVRQLRLALVVPRIQIALQRVQIQQGRVDRLSTQLETLRQQITDAASEDARLAGGIRDLEARVGQEQDAVRRRQMEDTIRNVKTETEFRTSRDQQRRAHEAELSGRLQSEQSRLTELSDELSRLEKSLGLPPPPPRP